MPLRTTRDCFGDASNPGRIMHIAAHQPKDVRRIIDVEDATHSMVDALC
jgi:hypothetical protein